MISTFVNLHFSLGVSVVSHFQWEVQDQRSQWRADIKRISKMNSSLKSLHVGLMLTWWGFSSHFDAERIKERSLIEGPVTCSHMKHGGSPRPISSIEPKSWKQIKQWLSKPLGRNKPFKRLIIAIKPLICSFDFYFAYNPN